MRSVCFVRDLPMKTGAFSISPKRKVMKMGIYSQIKAQVSTRDVAEHYGYKVGRNGMMCCPFHEDQNPSIKVDQNFIFFGCQEKGDVIDFAAKLFGVTAFEAAGKLITDMGLTVAEEKQPKARPGAFFRARLARMKEQQFDRAVNRIYHIYCDYFRLLNTWAVVYAPRSMTEKPHPLFVEAMHQRDSVEYLLDRLLYGSNEEKARIVIEKGKEVNDLERRIHEFESGGRKCPLHDDGSASAGNDDRCCEGFAGNDGERAGQEQRVKRRNDPVL